LQSMAKACITVSGLARRSHMSGDGSQPSQPELPRRYRAFGLMGYRMGPDPA